MLLSRPAAGSISSGYGPRVGPGSAFHRGIDFSWDGGWDIAAAAPGTVTFAGWRPGYGNLTIIDHGEGHETWYAHQSRFNVARGATVSRGQVIGVIGNTGASFGAHLHFEHRIDGTPMPPSFGSTAADTIAPIEEEEDDMALKIIRPKDMPDRAIVGPGFGLVFGDTEGYTVRDYEHFTNVWGLDRDNPQIIGDDSMAPSTRRKLLHRIVEMHRAGSAPRTS